MNLFVTDLCPEASAMSLDDKRVGKLLTEANMMMSVAIKLRFGITDESDEVGEGRLCRGLPYSNHPVAKWVKASRGNFEWTLEHAQALAGVYQSRFGVSHASWNRTYHIRRMGVTHKFQGAMGVAGFQNSARHQELGIDFTHLPVPQAYRHYLLARWQTDTRPVKWTNCNPPSWAGVCLAA